MSELDVCPKCGHVQANVNNPPWQKACRGCGWLRGFDTGGSAASKPNVFPIEEAPL